MPIHFSHRMLFAYFRFAALGAAVATSIPAHAQSQTLYVANYGPGGNSTLETFNSSGVGTQFNVTLPAGFAISHVAGLAIDGTGNLYVSNFSDSDFISGPNEGNIDKINTLTGIGAAFNVPGSVNLPTGLAFDSSGNLYAANEGTGNFIEKFDTSGTGTLFNANQIYNPYGIAFDNQGNLYAANYGNGTITKIDSNGNPVQLVSDMVGGGTYGVAVNSAGDIYVSQNYYGDGYVKEYSPTFHVISEIVGGGGGAVDGPSALTFNNAGDLYVANSNDNTIEVFKNGDLSNGTQFNVSGTLNNPVALVFGPSAESATTPEPGSLGLLIGVGFAGVSLLVWRRSR